MQIQPSDVQNGVEQLRKLLEVPFWGRGEFWISTVIGLCGVGLSYAAFRQAEAAKEEAIKAKHAATEAGRTVKLQTMSIELTEIAQKLERVQPGIKFNLAKELFNETSRRLRRAMAPFADHNELRISIEAVRKALESTQSALKQVRPADPTKEGDAPDAVYYGIEDYFATVNNCVADLLGLVEKETYDFGDENAGE
jgi:hypothetical protein